MSRMQSHIAKDEANSLVILFDGPTYAPNWIGVDFDEAEYVTQERIDISRVGRLIGFRDDCPVGRRLDVHEGMPCGDIGDWGVHCRPHETTHFGRRRKAPAFLTAGRSGDACGTSFVPCHGRWSGGKLPNEARILIEDCLVVEVGQNHEPLGCWMSLLPILDDGGDHLFSSLRLRLNLHVYQQQQAGDDHYHGKDCSLVRPSGGHYVTPNSHEASYAVPTEGSTF